MSVEWRSKLDASLEKNKDVPSAKYFQLATVSKEGLPTNRTVVLRKFLNETRISFVTDVRTKKVEDVLVNKSQGAICWYFPETREQYRLTGPMLVITDDYPDPQMLEARRQAWQELSPSVKAWHMQPPPGDRVGGTGDQETPGEATETPDPHPNFGLVVLEPHIVDLVDLFGNSRFRYTLDEQGSRTWTSQAVNP